MQTLWFLLNMILRSSLSHYKLFIAKDMFSLLKDSRYICSSPWVRKKNIKSFSPQSLYFSALRLTVTCCLLLDLYPLEEGLAQYIKSRRKLGLTLTGLVLLNASGSLYQLEKGLRNKSQSCLFSSAVRLLLPCIETHQRWDLLIHMHSRAFSLPAH